MRLSGKLLIELRAGGYYRLPKARNLKTHSCVWEAPFTEYAAGRGIFRISTMT